MTLRGGGGSRLSVIMTLTVGNMICESPLSLATNVLEISTNGEDLGITKAT